ncbi:S-adenosyl-L-methionine-dependent methyltransferase [Syncephalis pseudoplumigaleata]|uniref:tRNA N(3)-methylcytidine methyltransferase n=1 Tax=Syncephalis pseudoplumigaleata TaxID=1712513 RepID=A0A4P9Z4S8_9FUNG|nr:S-adenosyl-L-methionine-dependent methyltransferase [Syncephalis pseudoplumigaleata]|eukprot:RKP27475.1 S-adenosyl-L-methionine-dependent methyltransferase [Syncephalis pseudoplumigaleata]
MDTDQVEQAKAILAQDTQTVPTFWSQKYRKEAARHWDLFYKRNTTNFFKDRHWIDREFSELSTPCTDDNGAPRRKLVLEVGCGVGNFVFPTMREHPHHRFFACDFSPRAVEFVRAHPEYDNERCHAFVCDLTRDPLVELIPRDEETRHGVDVVSMIFVLSAIPPEKMADALANVAAVVRPGGVVLFRDYGLYDMAQLRFKPGHKLEENLYVRQDGTMAYYFTVEHVQRLFDEAGFDVLPQEEKEAKEDEEAATSTSSSSSLTYITRTNVNRYRAMSMHRIFVQGRFRRRSKAC